VTLSITSASGYAGAKFGQRMPAARTRQIITLLAVALAAGLFGRGSG